MCLLLMLDLLKLLRKLLFLHHALLKDRLGDQRGGSEWEPIEILLQRENSA
jgi:hypothetical protein